MLSFLYHSLRLTRVGFVFAREGVLGLVEPRALPPLARFGVRIARIIERGGAQNRAEKLSNALVRLGPTYVKLGQFLATRSDVVGAQIASDLTALQDRVPPFAQEKAERLVEMSLGKPISALFTRFDGPVAAASIAQVHKAYVAQEGVEKAVAVKVLRPEVSDRFRADLSDYYFVARWAEKLSIEARRLKPIAVVDTLARSMAMELDLRLEAAALSEMAERTAQESDFRVPRVDWVRTGRDCLTLEWIDGIKANDREALIRAGHDLPHLAITVIQSFLRHALGYGFFHADMHQGNLFIDADGQLVAVDFGIMGRIGMKERRFLAEILYGFITRNYRRVAEVHFEAGYVPSHHSVDEFAQAIRAIGEPIHSRTAEDISMAKLLSLLFEITGIFEMETRPELVLLQKTMVVVEGVARSLDPAFDMWSASEPVIKEWIARHLGPVGHLETIGQGAGSLMRTLVQLPDLLNEAAKLTRRMDDLTRDGFHLAPETLKGIGEAEAKRNRWSTWALWVIAALLAYHILGG